MHSFTTGTRNLADIHYCQMLSNGFNLGTISVPLFGSITGTQTYACMIYVHVLQLVLCVIVSNEKNI